MNQLSGFVLLCLVFFVFITKTLSAVEPYRNSNFSFKNFVEKKQPLELFGRFELKSIKNEKNKVVGVKDEMLLILEGEFRMGADPKEGYQECKKYSGRCDPKWFYHEAPIHDVHLSSFYMDKYEVTQRKFQLVMGRNPSSFRGDDHPVENVKWIEANEYCKKIGKRLPTEAEWEKAAQVKNPTKYFWGNEMKSGRANFCDKNCLSDWKTTEFDDGFVNTAPVGSYAPNAYGLYDMAGNVWEWVFDWYSPDYYKQNFHKDPTGPEPDHHPLKKNPLELIYGQGERVLRGGSWSSHPFNLRYSTRAGAYFNSRYINGYGFRCAVSGPSLD